MKQTQRSISSKKGYFKLAIFSNLFLTTYFLRYSPSFARFGVYAIRFGFAAMLCVCVIWIASPIIMKSIANHRLVFMALDYLLIAAQFLLMFFLLFANKPVTKLATAFSVCWTYLAALCIRATLVPINRRHFAACASLCPSVWVPVCILCSNVLNLGMTCFVEDIPPGPIILPPLSRIAWLLFAVVSAAPVLLIVILQPSTLNRMGEFCRSLPYTDVITILLGYATIFMLMITTTIPNDQSLLNIARRYVDISTYDPFGDLTWFIFAFDLHISVWRCLILWPPDSPDAAQ